MLSPARKGVKDAPTVAAPSVEPTMSVKRTVASTRSGSRSERVPVRSSSTGSRIESMSPTQGKWSAPGSSRYFAPAIHSAMYRAPATRLRIGIPDRPERRYPIEDSGP